MKAFKKPIAVHFRRLMAPEIVKTLEGDVSATKDHVVIIGVRGEQYPIPVEEFERTYNYSDYTNKCHKKKIIVDVEQLEEPEVCYVRWSNEPLQGKPGDYKVNYGDHCAIVEKSIFEETYEIVDEKETT